MQGEIAAFHGRPGEGIEKVQRALRLNPHPPGWYYWELGYAQYAARRHEAAVETLREESTYRTGSRRILAASLAQLGRVDEARQEAELFMVSRIRISPSVTGPRRNPSGMRPSATTSLTDIAKPDCPKEVRRPELPSPMPRPYRNDRISARG